MSAETNSTELQTFCCGTCTAVGGADIFHFERQLDVCDADGPSAGLLGDADLLCCLSSRGAPLLLQPGHLGQQGGALLTCIRKEEEETMREWEE